MMTPNHKRIAVSPTNAESSNPTSSPFQSFSALRQDPDLLYRLRVLLYDLKNVAVDASSQKRISKTTNELYISEPYFTDPQATAIRSAQSDHLVAFRLPSDASEFLEQPTIEEMIHFRLANFLDKRRASGDARPCGPHDMVPIYSEILSISREEIKDERFLSRLRRSGLDDSHAKVEAAAKENEGNSGKRRKRRGKKHSKHAKN